ncbi:MAG: EamA family transporter [Actinomycetota bacterium]|nr:EamA family transporter [Actinomycetota bacterium]
MKRLVLLAGIWGWSFLFIKVAVAGFTPSTVAALRVALGAAVVLGFLRARGLRLPAGREWWRHFVVVALAGSALPFTLLAWGEQHISSALSAVLNASTPLFAALFARLLLGDRLRAGQVAGLALGFVGVAVAVGLGVEDLTGSALGGELAAVVAGAGYGLAFAYTRRHLTTIPPIVAAAGQLVTATVLLAPFALFTSVRQGIHPTPTRVTAIVLLGALGTGVAYVLSYRLIADVGPTRASLVTYLIPIVAVTVGVLFLDEEFSFRLVIGGGLTIAGIALLNVGGRARGPVVAGAPGGDGHAPGEGA